MWFLKRLMKKIYFHKWRIFRYNRVSHFDTCVGKKCATKFFPLFRVLGPPKKNFSSFQAVWAVAQAFWYLLKSKGPPLVHEIFFSHKYSQYGYQKLCKKIYHELRGDPLILVDTKMLEQPLKLLEMSWNFFWEVPGL